MNNTENRLNNHNYNDVKQNMKSLFFCFIFFVIMFVILK